MNEKIQDFFLNCDECVLINPRNFYGCFTLGPFKNSQSLTVANALRRTLLSEIRGVAITHLEIDGAIHEYSTLKGVRESILDILLNFKHIVLKNTAPFQKPLLGYLNVRGPGIVRAVDLKLPSIVQCVDPDQYIATLSEDGKLILKFTISDFQNFTQMKEISENFQVPEYRNNEPFNFKMTKNQMKKPSLKTLKNNISNLEHTFRCARSATKTNRFFRGASAASGARKKNSIEQKFTSTSTTFQTLKSIRLKQHRTNKPNFFSQSTQLTGVPRSKFASRLAHWKDHKQATNKQQSTFVERLCSRKSFSFILFYKAALPQGAIGIEQSVPGKTKSLQSFSASAGSFYKQGLQSVDAAARWRQPIKAGLAASQLNVHTSKSQQVQQRLMNRQTASTKKLVNQRSTSLHRHQRPTAVPKTTLGSLKTFQPFTKEKQQTTNSLWVDPLFNPILKVNYLIETIQPIQTNILNQRIRVELWTNGSIHPRKAFYDALTYLKTMFDKLESMKYLNYKFTNTLLESEKTMNKILKTFEYDFHFYNSLEEKNVFSSTHNNFIPKEIQQIEKEYSVELFKNSYKNILEIPIDRLSLPSRLKKALTKNNFFVIGDILKYSPSELKTFPGIGKLSISIIQKYFAKIGLKLESKKNK
uniref:alpha subunit of RNA polymerase n=1 Tax=Coelastrella saipanensis TaxID=152631 RepID=UPI0010C430F2|nr:alpha subunit of RNA polymerase [Coelastrella saipanensis]AVV61607.1 alpha subunit of RNA polymerase [Coelastrella saipanensis]